MDEPVGGVADGLTLGRRGEPGTRAVPSTHGLVIVPRVPSAPSFDPLAAVIVLRDVTLVAVLVWSLIARRA
jgi:hypothetical protein